MHLNQLINPASLAHDMSEGFIRTNRHPWLPLTLFNYTEKAQFARHWNKATLACRGLIVHDDGTVIARPFPKFFNWDEPKPKGREHQMGMDEPVVVTDKLDGSLGILYSTKSYSGYAIATRGSFTSDQALHATQVWKNQYASEFEDRINPRLTYLFEIIYPSNRIVVDYKGLDDLVLIGAVDIEGGFIYGPEMVPGWPGPRALVYPYKTLSEAVSAKPRAGMEGFVVRSLSDSLMVKVKYEDYVRLHRIVTGLNEKEIWRRAMKADLGLAPEVQRMDVVLQDIPDELHTWATDIATKLFLQVHDKYSEAWDVYRRVVGIDHPFKGFVDREDRKQFALAIKDKEPWLQKTLWILYDQNDPKEFLWKTLEPRGDVKK